jgi:hypothetical protein
MVKMQFLISVAGYTLFDKERSEIRTSKDFINELKKLGLIPEQNHQNCYTVRTFPCLFYVFFPVRRR